jgi:putative transposase
MRINPKKRLERETAASLAVPTEKNETGSMGFMPYSLANGLSIRLFNVIDDFNREGLGIEILFSFPTERVILRLNILTT